MTLRQQRHNFERAEIKLIRVGHVIWRLYKAERDLCEQARLLEACQTVWAIKKQVRLDWRGR